MTRINIVPTSELADQHLVAEYRELFMVGSALVRTLKSKNAAKTLNSLPEKYTLNTGHVKFFYNKCYIDELYEIVIIKPSKYLGRGFWKSIDIDLIDNLGPNGISRLVSSFGLKVSKLQSGYLYHYVLSVVIGLTLFISIYIYIF